MLTRKGQFLNNDMGQESRRCLLVALLVLTIAGVSSNLTPPPATNRPPHIIFIVADDLADPTEHFNIADQHPDIVEDMIRKLEKYRESLVPAHLGNRQDFPKPDIVAQTGIWSPGWC